MRTGAVTSGAGRLVSHLPKEPNSNHLDFKRLSAICDIAVARGYLQPVKNMVYRDAAKITDAGLEFLALRSLDQGSNQEREKVSQIGQNVVIISIREDENQAVLDRLGAYDFVAQPNRTYAHTSLMHDSGKELQVFAMRQAEQGPNFAQDSARDAIEDLDPCLILLVGIAGAVPDNEFTLGDVMIAVRLHDFVVGAALEGELPARANQGGPMTKEVQDVAALLPAISKTTLKGWNYARSIKCARPPVQLDQARFYGSDEWQQKVNASLVRHFSPRGRNSPILTARSNASSGMLVKDT